MKSKFAVVSLLLALVAALVLAGCSAKPKEPKDALLGSMTKSADIKSYHFEGQAVLEDFSFQMEGSNEMVSMLKGAELSYSGAYRQDPMMMEATLKLSLKGDMAISFEVPIVATESKLWVKVPSIPMLPLPESVQGKFVELDLKELAEQSGQPLPSPNLDTMRLFANDLMAIVFKHIDANTYLSTVKAKEAGLPDGVKADQIVRLQLTKDGVEPLLTAVKDKIAPEVLDLLAEKAEYRELTGLQPEDIDAARQELGNEQDMTEALAEFNKSVKTMDITALIGIDKDEYPTYTEARIKMDVDDNGQPGSFGMKMSMHLTDINKDPTFQIGEPKDTVSMEELLEQLGMSFGA